MFRSLIAVIVALAIAVVGFVTPAYASSDSVVPVNPPIVINGNDSFVPFNNSLDSLPYKETIERLSNTFVEGIVNGIVGAAGGVIGGTLVCYTLDGIATAFFPPAAAAAAFCPPVGVASGGAKLVFETAR